MITHLAFVDSLQSLQEAKLKAPDAVFITDNPLLAEDPETQGLVRNVDLLLSQKDALKLGAEALRLTNLVDAKINDSGIAQELGLVENHLRTGGSISRLFSSIFYRAAVMSRALAEYKSLKKISLFTADQSALDGNIPFVSSRFSAPYPRLSKQGFFGELSVSTYPIDVLLPKSVNETATENVFLKVAMIPLGFLLMRVLKINRLNLFVKKTIYIGGENEALRETIPWLLSYGFGFKKIGKLITAPAYVPDREAITNISAIISPLVGEIIDKSLASLAEYSPAQCKAIKENTLEHLAAGLDAMQQSSAALEKRLENIVVQSGRPTFLLTNGLFGPIGAQVYGLCRKRGIKVIDFEHGVTTGLSALSQEKIEYSEISSCDALMVSSNGAKASFEIARDADDKTVCTIGLADKVRKVSHYHLQRFVVRKRLGIKSSETAVFHISTYTHSANVRPGLGTPTESLVFDTNRDLICKAYQNLPHRVFFKPYPTQRFPHEPPYESVFSEAKNIQFLTEEDFRYSRSGADIIVTSTPTSTLGWCVGCDVPLVWLDSKITNPLISDTLRQQFQDSFISINLDEPNWPERLHSVLNRDVYVIYSEWKSKAEARQVLLENTITGPSGSVGRRAAGIINGMWCSANSGRTHV